MKSMWRSDVETHIHTLSVSDSELEIKLCSMFFPNHIHTSILQIEIIQTELKVAFCSKIVIAVAVATTTTTTRTTIYQQEVPYTRYMLPFCMSSHVRSILNQYNWYLPGTSYLVVPEDNDMKSVRRNDGSSCGRRYPVIHIETPANMLGDRGLTPWLIVMVVQNTDIKD